MYGNHGPQWPQTLQEEMRANHGVSNVAEGMSSRFAE
jgi:hypothetical protein